MLVIGLFLTLLIGCFIYFILKRRKVLIPAYKAFQNLDIHIITTTEECDGFIYELKCRCDKSKGAMRGVGFDCEWTSLGGRRNPIALLQLSTPDGLCGLIRLNILKHIPKSLQRLLMDPVILKLGVAPMNDAKYIYQDYGVAINGFLDIRYIVELRGYEAGGLAALSRVHLNVILDKDWRISCSNWEADHLSGEQLLYAAADAYVAVKIFGKLYNEYKKCHQRAISGELEALCIMRQNEDFNVKSAKKQVFNRNSTNTLAQYKKSSAPLRAKPLYDNCLLQAPDGELLCTIHEKKANWYVYKELGDVVAQDPLTVRLRFEPAGRAVGEVGRFYQQPKENKCVVCGNNNSYIRKHVVPREYRKHFPEIMKDHSSHDVLLLCARCHQLSNIRDLSYRQQLAYLCKAPLDTRSSPDFATSKIRSSARALLNSRPSLPEERCKELEAVILRYYPDHEQITDQLLEEASGLQVCSIKSDEESHGEKVVNYFLEGEGLLGLERGWREHFLKSMGPRHMPELWSITHTEQGLRIKFQDGRLTKEDFKSIGGKDWDNFLNISN